MAPSPTARRLLKETAELSPASKHPNPTFHAAPLSEDNLHEWHFTLLGPPAPSPYAGGIYHGRITLPPAYPMKPPNFRFLTPSGRFEVNREICLSISGFHEETWQPAWGVRLALTALRGFMGEEGTAGQVGGLESSRTVRERLARESRTWKCSRCGGDEEGGGDNKRRWTNEERMEWWWGVCREKGVDVESEVAGMQSLPEGMRLEAREKEAKGKQKEVTSPEDDGQRAEAAAQKRPVEDTTIGAGPELLMHDAAASPVPASAPALPAPKLSSTSPETRTNHDRMQGVASATALSTSTTTTPQRQLQPIPQLPQRQAESPITIDRAITVVFLALCVMILKKLFYPGSTSALFGGYDDLRMMRE